MGCCLSTTKKSHSAHKTGSTDQQFPAKSPVTEPDLTCVRHQRTPPPPPLEEESVKEVLSETPIVSRARNPIPVEEKVTEIPIETKGPSLIPKADKEISEASQISESFSLSTTTTTTTITEKKEEDEAMSKRNKEVGQSAPNRPQPRGPRKRPHTGEVASRRIIPARGSSEARTGRLNMGTTGVRRDSREGLGGRSRSPATRTAGGAGRGSGKGTIRAGGPSMDSRVQSKQSSGDKEEPSDGVPQQANDSLDNPLVSLECFIFL